MGVKIIGKKWATCGQNGSTGCENVEEKRDKMGAKWGQTKGKRGANEVENG